MERINIANIPKSLLLWFLWLAAEGDDERLSLTKAKQIWEKSLDGRFTMVGRRVLYVDLSTSWLNPTGYNTLNGPGRAELAVAELLAFVEKLGSVETEQLLERYI